MRSAVVMALLATACGARPAETSSPRETSGGARTDEIATQTATGTGTIAGVVTDAKTHEAIAGSTIVVALPSEPRQVVTATSGHYEIPALPAGDYLVSFYYGDFTGELEHVVVRAGQTAVADWTFDQTRPGEDVRATWTPVYR